VDLTDTLPAPGEATGLQEWLPFLRGGIVKGSMAEVLDISAPHPVRSKDVFRNPIGPAVAQAYLLSEQSGIEGMRLMITEPVRDGFIREVEELAAVEQLRTFATRLTPIPWNNVPDCGTVYEVPWFELFLMSNNHPSGFNSLIAAEQQFQPSALKHYRGTWDMVLGAPSVQHSESLWRIANGRRRSVVTKMAEHNWRAGGCLPGNDWYDWFRAEGILPPRRGDTPAA
jgi:hypothetical protein